MHNQFSRDVQNINDRANEPKNWGVAVLGLIGLFFVYPVVMYWVVDHFGFVAWFVVIPVSIMVVLCVVVGIWSHIHGNRTAGSA